MALRPSSSTREFLERTCSVTKNGRLPEPYTQTKLVITNRQHTFINHNRFYSRMDLREIRKEVETLEDLQQHLCNFKSQWIAPVRANSNKQLPFLQNLPTNVKVELNEMLAQFQLTIDAIENHTMMQHKLRHYSKYLVQLALADLRSDTKKTEFVTNHVLNDEFLSLQNAIDEVKQLHSLVEELKVQYDTINLVLEPHLALEHSITFGELPHKKHLMHIEQAAVKYKTLLKHMGTNFIMMAAKSRMKK
jgi:hypothetical protein